MSVDTRVVQGVAQILQGQRRSGRIDPFQPEAIRVVGLRGRGSVGVRLHQRRCEGIAGHAREYPGNAGKPTRLVVAKGRAGASELADRVAVGVLHPAQVPGAVVVLLHRVVRAVDGSGLLHHPPERVVVENQRAVSKRGRTVVSTAQLGRPGLRATGRLVLQVPQPPGASGLNRPLFLAERSAGGSS